MKQKANPLRGKDWKTDSKKPSAEVYADKDRIWDKEDAYQPPLPGEDGTSRLINGNTNGYCSHCGWISIVDGTPHTTKEHKAMENAKPGKFKSKHAIFCPKAPPTKPAKATAVAVKSCKSNESKKKCPPRKKDGDTKNNRDEKEEEDGTIFVVDWSKLDGKKAKFTVGKYRGHTYASVMEKDPAYAIYLLGEGILSEKGSPNSCFKLYVGWAIFKGLVLPKKGTSGVWFDLDDDVKGKAKKKGGGKKRGPDADDDKSKPRKKASP